MIYKEPENEEERVSYQLENLAHANWAVKKLAYHRSRCAEYAQTASEISEEAFAWAKNETATHQADIVFLESILRNYHIEILAKDENRKTITLPSGVLTARKVPGSLEINEEVFISYAEKERPDLLKIVSSPKKTEISKEMKETGEVFPGVTRIKGETKYTIKETSD